MVTIISLVLTFLLFKYIIIPALNDDSSDSKNEDDWDWMYTGEGWDS